MTITTDVCGFESGNEEQWGGSVASSAVNATAALHGAYGLHMNPSGVAASHQRQFGAGTTRVFLGRFAIHFPTLPTGTEKELLLLRTSLAFVTERMSLRFDPADNTLDFVTMFAGADAHRSSGPVIEAGTTYTIAFCVRGSSFGDLFDWSIDGVAMPQITGIGGVIAWAFGTVASDTYSVYFDDVSLIYTVDASDQDEVFDMHPLDHEGYVRALDPVASGTHVGSGSFTPSTGTLADSWQFLNDRPILSSTSYVEQTIQGAGDYVEYEIQNMPDDEQPLGPLAVLFGMRSSGLSANNAKWHVVIDGVDEFVASGLWLATSISIAGQGLNYRELDREAVNSLLVRWGYSEDVISAPRLGALLVEVDVRPFIEPPGGGGVDGPGDARESHAVVWVGVPYTNLRGVNATGRDHSRGQRSPGRSGPRPRLRRG